MKRLTYDPKANAAYAYASEEPVDKTVEINPNINVDLSSKGRAVGIEILNAKAVLSKVLAVRLNAAELQKIEYEIEQSAGIYLRIRCDQHHASIVLPGRISPA